MLLLINHTSGSSDSVIENQSRDIISEIDSKLKGYIAVRVSDRMD